jgi:ribosome maturation factor RimP
VTEELDSVGFELVELRRGGSRSRPTLQVRLDRRDGATVSVEDCARASRALEARLDAEGSAGDRYVLEVSSPGLDRPLRRPDDWRRFVGRRANVLSPSLGGRQEVQVVGVEGEPGAEVIVVRTDQGAEQRVPLDDVREARLAFHWKHERDP